MRRGDRGDGVDLCESERLGQNSRRRLSGGRNRESKGRQSGDGEHGQLHLDSSGWFFADVFGVGVRKLSKRRVEIGESEAQVVR